MVLIVESTTTFSVDNVPPKPRLAKELVTGRIESEDDPDDPLETSESLVCGEANDLFTCDELANTSRPNRENARSIRLDFIVHLLKFAIGL